MLITSPILAFPDSDGEFILDVDASAYGWVSYLNYKMVTSA